MKFIITAGGTTEKIDNIRKISNTSTGKLGSLIAKKFIEKSNDIQKIYYICEKGSITPSGSCVEIVNTIGVEAVKDSIESIMSTDKIDAVIHSMAVSDYSVKSLTTTEDLALSISHGLFKNLSKYNDETSLAKYIESLIIGNDRVISSTSKVSSYIEHPLITLKQTPKIISLIKDIDPGVMLVGFKLLSNVSEEELISVAHKLLIKNRCDFVLANDLNSINSGNHTGFLLSPDKTYIKLEGKDAIAEGIVEVVLKNLERKRAK